VQLGHTDGGRLVMTLYGHPNEDRARDRLDIAFAADGHNSAAAAERLGHNSAAGGNGIAARTNFAAFVPAVSTFARYSKRPPHLIGRRAFR
jgi:hypothetical protein